MVQKVKLDLVSPPDLDPLFLPPMDWFAGNHSALAHFVHKQRGAQTPGAALIDWDNTCIFGDITEVTFAYMLEHLQLRLPPAALNQLLPRRINGITVLDSGVSLHALADDILAAYQALWPAMEAGSGATQRHTPAHRDLRAKLTHLCLALEHTRGIGPNYVATWLPCFLGGHSEASVAELVRKAWDHATAENIAQVTWRAANHHSAGQLSATFQASARLLPEMQSLLRKLQEVGMQVVIVSASAQILVRALCRHLDYGIAPECIYGMRLRQQGDCFSPQLLPQADYPHTMRKGKVQIAERLIQAPPLLAAGDADTDFELLTELPSLKLRLIINRNAKGAIGQLYRLALQPTHRAVPTLLQGRDENRGCFVPARETTPLGAQRPQAIPL